MEERKTITMEELDEIMSVKKGIVFDADSVDTYGMSISMLCSSVRFEKAMDGEYCAMILSNDPTEVEIETDIIEEIYLDSDETITIEFNNYLPDLEIRYRE